VCALSWAAPKRARSSVAIPFENRPPIHTQPPLPSIRSGLPSHFPSLAQYLESGTRVTVQTANRRIRRSIPCRLGALGDPVRTAFRTRTQVVPRLRSCRVSPPLPLTTLNLHHATQIPDNKLQQQQQRANANGWIGRPVVIFTPFHHLPSNHPPMSMYQNPSISRLPSFLSPLATLIIESAAAQPKQAISPTLGICPRSPAPHAKYKSNPNPNRIKSRTIIPDFHIVFFPVGSYSFFLYPFIFFVSTRSNPLCSLNRYRYLHTYHRV